jgi:hypothetical protein
MHAIVPALAAAGPASITVVRASTLAETIDLLGLSPTGARVDENRADARPTAVRYPR